MTAGLRIRSMLAALATAMFCAAPPTALAQGGYESAFDGYRSFREPSDPLDWRAANRTAGELGGFVGQMRASARPPPGGPGARAATPEAMRGMPEMLAKHRERASTGLPADASPGAAMPMHPAPWSPEPGTRDSGGRK